MVALLAACGCGGAAPRETEQAATTPPTRGAQASAPAVCGRLRATVTGHVSDASITELSGLVRGRSRPGALWAHEDSGSAPVIHALASDGRVLARVPVTGAHETDWEDIAAGPGPLLYVGDIGDNGESRSSIAVYRFPEPGLDGRPTAPAQRLALRYPDRPHDAEALLVDPAREELIVVTKALGGGRAYVASARAPAGEATLRAGPGIPLALVTAGDVSADGRVVALRSYTRVAIWRRRGREPLTTTLRRAPCVSPTSLQGEEQGEALALDRHGMSFVTVPEGRSAAMRRWAPSR
jgi:hypothetical protein